MVRYDISKTRENIRLLRERKINNSARLAAFSKLLKRRGHEELSELLHKISENDKEHALILMQFNKEEPAISGIIQSLADEKYEMHNHVIAEYEHIAHLENIRPAQELLSHLKEIEAEHEKILLKILNDVQSKKIFHKDNIVRWRCRKCGHVAEGNDAPKKCVFCSRPQGYFEITKN